MTMFLKLSLWLLYGEEPGWGVKGCCREGTVTNVTWGVMGAWPRVVAGEVVSSSQTRTWTGRTLGT